MITISINPILFSIGHFSLRWYSLIVMAAIAIGIWIASREAKRKGLPVEKFYDMTIWVVIAGLLGARLFHVIDHWSDIYAFNPIQAFYFWDGGLAIWGGVIGGILAAALFALTHQWKIRVILDALVPGAVLGQAIGRFACIITGDAVGRPTTGPLGFEYTSPNSAVPQTGVYYFPTPILEIIMNFGIFGLLWILRKKKLRDGFLSLLYLVLYSVGRFFINFYNTYRIIALGLDQAQWISLDVLAISLPILLYLLISKKSIHLQAGS